MSLLGFTCCQQQRCCLQATSNTAELVESHQAGGMPGLGTGENLVLSDGVEPQASSLSYQDGSTYEGQVVEGKRQGHGLWKSTALQYEGQFRFDQQNGEGTQTWRDGRVYKGQFTDGKFEGHGRMEWQTPSGMLVYEGQYKNDAKDGKGRFVWPDGRIYDGEWSRGKRWGKGTYVNSRGESRQGQWADDKLEKWLEDYKK